MRDYLTKERQLKRRLFVEIGRLNSLLECNGHDGKIKAKRDHHLVELRNIDIRISKAYRWLRLRKNKAA